MTSRPRSDHCPPGAAITATRFVNEYHWDDFKGDPSRLMERFHDAHLYVANWGTRRVMFRLPCDLLDPDIAEEYCVGDDDLEPPVPHGLRAFTAAQRALADFLCLDDDLLAIAAQTSPSLQETADDANDLAARVAGLPVAEKDRFLALVIQGQAQRVRMELLRRFRCDAAPTTPAPATDHDSTNRPDHTDTFTVRTSALRRTDAPNSQEEKPRATGSDPVARGSVTGSAPWSRSSGLGRPERPSASFPSGHPRVAAAQFVGTG